MGRKKLKFRKTDEKDYAKNRLKNIRLLAIEILGGECEKCGFSDMRALQINHIKGGGNNERKMVSGNFSKHVIKSVLNNENKFQLLCANCNWIKRSDNNETKKVRSLL